MLTFACELGVQAHEPVLECDWVSLWRPRTAARTRQCDYARCESRSGNGVSSRSTCARVDWQCTTKICREIGKSRVIRSHSDSLSLYGDRNGSCIRICGALTRRIHGIQIGWECDCREDSQNQYYNQEFNQCERLLAAAGCLFLNDDAVFTSSVGRLTKILISHKSDIFACQDSWVAWTG